MLDADENDDMRYGLREDDPNDEHTLWLTPNRRNGARTPFGQELTHLSSFLSVYPSLHFFHLPSFTLFQLNIASLFLLD